MKKFNVVLSILVGCIIGTGWFAYMLYGGIIMVSYHIGGFIGTLLLVIVVGAIILTLFKKTKTPMVFAVMIGVAFSINVTRIYIDYNDSQELAALSGIYKSCPACEDLFIELPALKSELLFEVGLFNQTNKAKMANLSEKQLREFIINGMIAIGVPGIYDKHLIPAETKYLGYADPAISAKMIGVTAKLMSDVAETHNNLMCTQLSNGEMTPEITKLLIKNQTIAPMNVRMENLTIAIRNARAGIKPTGITHPIEAAAEALGEYLGEIFKTTTDEKIISFAQQLADEDSCALLKFTSILYRQAAADPVIAKSFLVEAYQQ